VSKKNWKIKNFKS